MRTPTPFVSSQNGETTPSSETTKMMNTEAIRTCIDFSIVVAAVVINLRFVGEGRKKGKERN